MQKKEQSELNQITFIITSVIFYENRKLSYSPVRSIYNPTERAEQTIKTVDSIYKALPNAIIILVELGKQKVLPLDLHKKIDKYIYLGHNPIVRYACDSIYKGLGEAVGMIFALLIIKKSQGLYFKISGRYFLNDNFDIKNWNISGFTFRKYYNAYSTRLFSYSKDSINILIMAYFKSINKLRSGISIENTLYELIPQKKISVLNQIGIAGNVAPDGVLLSE